MPDLIINSETSLQDAIGQLREWFKERRYFTLRAKFGKARTLNTNALSHAWYEQVARELREDDARGVKGIVNYILACLYSAQRMRSFERHTTR